MQTLLTFIIVSATVAYAVWRVSRVVRNVNDRCYGCAGCTFHDMISKRKGLQNVAQRKKDVEKFWCYREK